MFDAAAAVGRLGVPVRGLFCDSRRAARGGAFVAYPGAQTDGRQHIPQALQAGACGVFWEPEGFQWPAEITAPNAPVPSLAHRAGFLADEVYGAPSRRLFVAGITGTNGKTTASHFAAQLLRQSGADTGQIGTLGAGMADEELTPADNTTPDALALHEMLRDFAAAGAKAAVLEISSHGIAQRRIAGIRFSAAALLNIGRDHLDYHGDMESYKQTKAELLRAAELKTAVANADDADCLRAAQQAEAEKVWTFGERGETLRLAAVSSCRDGMEIELDGAWGKQKARLGFFGRHNIDNFMAAALIALAGGASWESFRPQKLRLPRGRLQRINPGESPAVYVDYAHTPDALEAALRALRGRCGGRLWAVFGCGGARDCGKRREMGKTAAALADIVLITDDNPRGEAADKIRAQIISGASGMREIPGRAEAIAAAVAEAGEKDAVLIAGKGHENYQEINGRRAPFSDEETARAALSAREKAGRC